MYYFVKNKSPVPLTELHGSARGKEVEHRDMKAHIQQMFNKWPDGRTQIVTRIRR